MLRNLALKLPLVLLLLMGIAAQGQGQSTHRFSDFSYLRNDLRSLDQRVEDFITDVRAGNRQAYKYVQYETLEAAIVRLMHEADEYPATRSGEDQAMRYLVATTATDEEVARSTLIRSTLPGIFNMDPRVRLVAANWLRGLRPGPEMQRAVKLAIGVDVEVIRYDDARGEFVFRAPRILETVASFYEYYREWGIDWPTSLQSGGPGPNNDEELLYQQSPQLRDGPNDNTTTGLSARRWGDFAPVYDQDLGYVPLTAEQRQNYYTNMFRDCNRVPNEGDANGGTVASGDRRGMPMHWSYWVPRPAYRWPGQGGGGQGGDNAATPAAVLRCAEIDAQARYGGDVFAPDLEDYRHYPDVRDEEGIRENAGLLLEQAHQEDELVPLGQGDLYVYLNRHGHIVMGSPWTELTKLDMFITRFVWWKKITDGQRNVMTYLTKDTFSTLFRSIDGERPEAIPFLSLATNNPWMVTQNDAAATDRLVDSLVNGLLRNPVLSNQYVILRGLKDIYADRYGVLDTTPQTKEKINVALWRFRRMANRLDYHAGQVLMAEALTVGKRPEDEWTAIAPVAAVTSTTEDVYQLEFRRPNDEIRATGYQLIVTDATVESNPDKEPRLNIDDLFNSRFYAYRRPNGTLVTWYNSRTEWEDRAANVDVTANAHLMSSNWIYNYDQMTRAQNIINGILRGDGEMLRLAEWSDVESAMILNLKRLQVMYALGVATETPQGMTTFFDVLHSLNAEDVVVRKSDGRKADAPAAANPDEREDVFAKQEDLVRGWTVNTYSDEKREAIKGASLGGLFNKDPRIRLTSLHFLRRLGPDESMLDAVVRARSIVHGAENATDAAETDDYLSRYIDTNMYERKKELDFITELRNRYRGVIPNNRLRDEDMTLKYDVLNPAYTVEGHEYQFGMRSSLPGESQDAGSLIKYFGTYQFKSPGEELDKLYRYIQRGRLVRAIKRGDVNAVVRMSRTDFGILSELIDDEYAMRVPLASRHTTTQDRSSRQALPSRFAVFQAEDISVIKRGIDSTNFLVQKGTAQFLIEFYNFYTGFDEDDDVKREIRDAMYFYKQDDIVVEEFVLAFEGENPDGRAVIMAGTQLSRDLNPGGERVYRTLPDNILMDIRDAVLDETARLPDALRAILGMITVRATDAAQDTSYTSRDTSVDLGRGPNPSEVHGASSDTPSATTGGSASTAPAGRATAPASGTTAPASGTTAPASGTTAPASSSGGRTQ